jgi:hypothetical protein
MPVSRFSRRIRVRRAIEGLRNAGVGGLWERPTSDHQADEEDGSEKGGGEDGEGSDPGYEVEAVSGGRGEDRRRHIWLVNWSSICWSVAPAAMLR